MKFSFSDIIHFVCIFQLLVFVSFLLRRKTGRPSNRFLAVFLLAQVAIIGNSLVYRFSDFFYNYFPHMFHLGVTFVLLAAPSFYFYVRSTAYSDFRLRKTDLLHLLPFVVVTLYYGFAFHFHSGTMKRALLIGNPYLATWAWIAFNVITFSQLFVYNIAGIRVLKQYRAAIREEYSSVQNINLSWLNLVLYAFLVAWLTSVAAFVARFFTPVNDELIGTLNLTAFFIFFNIIFYKALMQPEIFSGVEEKQKYQSSKLTAAEADSYLAALQSHMEEKKPYLNPTISLRDLAGQLSIPPRHLSQIINDRLHQNFYDFISRYRVEEAKRILSDPGKDKTVLEVLFEVGFNSKSSFNTAFKKFTNVTPSEYKESAN